MLLSTYKHHHTKTLLTFAICLDLGLSMSCPWDLIFIFIIISTMINHVFILIVIYNDFQRLQESKLLNGCLVAWPKPISTSNIQDRYWWLVILKFFQKCFWDSWILLYCQFNSYFFLLQRKNFSLTCSFIAAKWKRNLKILVTPFYG